MAPPKTRSAPDSEPVVPKLLVQECAVGSRACSTWLVSMLDVQTAWWRDMERLTADSMALWFKPVAPPSAQDFIDAAQSPPKAALLAGSQEAWNAWAQLWLGAMRHDLGDR